MRSFAFGLSAVLSVGLLSGLPSGAAAADPEQSVIVMLDSGSQDAFLGSARERGVKAKTQRRFSKLFNAVAMKVPASQVDDLRRMPGVKSVHPNLTFRTNTDASVPLIGATEVWQRKDSGGTAAKGKGVTVAVIDTGIDYTHPDLGGAFGDGHKVVGGYDYVNNDADPMDDHGHGTHVAGIIGGSAAQPGGITGVAPEVSLVAYKVMDEWGYGDTANIIAAIEAAVDPANPNRADVINLSIGSYGDGLDPVGLAATAATKAGVVVVAAAGNDGPGEYTVGTPAAADGVIAVGASISNLTLPEAYLTGGEKLQTYRGMLSANPAAATVTAQLVDAGYGTNEELDQAGDLTGKIVRVNRHIAPAPDSLFPEDFEMTKEIERRGALAVIGGQGGFGGPVLANQPGVASVKAYAKINESGDLGRMDKLIALGVDTGQYDELTTLLASGPVSLTIKRVDATDKIASFSSRGPSQRGELKPDLVAPGYEIKSTIPGGRQMMFSGTSMASPHVAGAAALMRQLRPGQTPEDVKAALVGTAKALSGSSPLDHGAGRLDIPAAVDAVLTATPSTLSFGLADLGRSTVEASARVTLHNSSDRVSITRFDGDLRVTPSTVIIPARGSVTVTMRLETPRLNEYKNITGTVVAKPSRGAAIRIPYLLLMRPLVVESTPDPSDGTSAITVAGMTELTGPPVLTIKPPNGASYQVTPGHLYGSVYRHDFTEEEAGAYVLSATATAAGGERLYGTGAVEVTPLDVRRNRWEPIGPNSAGGNLTTSGDLGVMTTDGQAGPWVTNDHGRSWKQLRRMPITATTGQGEVVIDPRNPAHWWYRVAGALLTTNDSGKTWERLAVPAGYLEKLIANADATILVALADTGLLVSTDGGRSWTTKALPVVAYDVAFGGNDLYLATGRTGIYKVPAATGDAVQVYAPTNRRSIIRLTADEQVVAGFIIGLGVIGSHDGGQTWNTLVTGSLGIGEVRAAGGDLVVTKLNGKMLVGADHGRVWTETDLPSRAAATYDYDRWADGAVTVANTAGLHARTESGYQRLGVQGETVTDLLMLGTDLLAGTDRGIYRTATPGSSPEWGPAEGEGYIGNGAQLLAASPSNPDIVWKVRQSPFGSFYIDRSSDGGKTFEQTGSGKEVPTSILVHPADPDRVYVGFGGNYGNGVVATTNGGQSWKNLYHNDIAPLALAGDPTDPKRLWIGTTAGLYRSDDGGITKTKVTDGWVSAISFQGRSMVLGGDTIRYSHDSGRTFRSGHTGPLGIYVADFVRVGHTIYAATREYASYGMYKGGRGVLRSLDGGATWQNVSSGLQNLDATTLAASADGKWLYVGTTNGGVHRMPLK